MTTEPPEQDFKSVWQDQPTERLTMSVTEIRARAKQFQLKGRLVLIINYLNATLMGAGFGWGIASSPSGIMKTGCAFGVLAGLMLAWWNHQRRPRRMPTAEVSGSSILEFHREELERAKIRFHTTALLGLPLLLSVGLVFAGAHAMRPGPVTITSFAIIPLLFGAWAWVFWFRTRAYSRKLQHQINDLDAIGLE